MSLFDTGIIPVVNAHLDEEAKKIRDYGDYWSASSAGYCMRKNIFERLGVPPVQEDARKQRVFSSGHIFHSWIQEITKKSGLSIAQEVELQDEDLMIRGHFDDLVLVTEQFDNVGQAKVSKDGGPWEDGEIRTPMVKQHLILYDYKTAHSKWFEYVKDRPMSHYNKMQLGTYMYMLRQKNYTPAKRKTKFDLEGSPAPADTRTLTEARILKISKDDLRLHEQQLLWSVALEDEILDYWKNLNKWWRDKKMPPCTCDKWEVNKKTGKGFMADPRYNPFFYEGEPCSLVWYNKCKEEGLI